MQNRSTAKVDVRLLISLVALTWFGGYLLAQTPPPTSPRSTTPPSQSPAPANTPRVAPSPGVTPLPQSTPFAVPSEPGPSLVPAATPAPVATPSPVSMDTQPAQNANPLTFEEALRLANSQASTFQQAGLNEQIAAEDVKQAEAAFLPKVSAPLSYIYTSPSMGQPAGTPRVQSFIANNAIGEYEALVNVAGDFDIAGKLRAIRAKNRALLAAAHAGTEVARRALAQAVLEAYYGLALTSAQRAGAEANLAAAEEFEHITSLLLSGGEIAAVDLTRAQLQTTLRRDELERARANEEVAAGSLRVLVGYDFTRSISTTDLALILPNEVELQQFNLADVSRRPEFTQLEAQLRAARQDIKIARSDRLPALSYSMNGGFDTDSLTGPRLKEHSGVSAAVSLGIPIFDWGATKSKERQARLRAQVAENERTVALRGFTQQFFAARAQAASAARRVRSAREGVQQAQTNLAASVARYRAGEAQIIEVTDAQTMLVTQRTTLYQALFDYQTALGRLKQATGQ